MSTQYTTEDSLKIEGVLSMADAVTEQKTNTVAKWVLSKSINDNSITVTKAIINSNRVGSNFQEGSTITAGSKLTKSTIKNDQTIYGDVIQLSRTSTNVDKTGVKVELKSAMNAYTEYIEKMTLNGEPVTGRVNKGLISMVPASNVTEVKGVVDGIKLATALAPIKSKANVIICDYLSALKLDVLAKQTDIEGGDGTFSGTIDRIRVRNCDAIIIVSDQMPANKALFLDDTYVERHYITNGEIEKLPASTYDGEQYKVVDESCIINLMPSSMVLVNFVEEV